MGKDLKETVSKILVKWNMPTRQVAINEIIEAVKIECIKSMPTASYIGFDDHGPVKERRAGFNACREKSINNIKNL